jgi:curved DNA-binding protein CbpA
VLSRLATPITLRQLLDIVPFSKPDVLMIIDTLAAIGFVTSAAEASPLPMTAQEDTQPHSAIPSADTALPARNELLEKQRLRAEALLQDLQDAGPRQVLGVAENATPVDIKAAYHRLAKEFHPDRFFSEVEGTEPAASVRELFEKIHLAYETLKVGAARGDSRAWPHGAKSGSQLAEPTPEEIETSARASHNQGVQHYQQRDFFSAVQHFREAVRMQPAVAKYRHSLARALMRNPRWRKESEEQFLKAIELDEFNADYRVSLGLLYLEGGFPRKAEAQFRDALAWDSENRTAQRELQKLQSLSQPPSWISKFLRNKKR